jgi:predicted  nucleic acid-binding Zn-ribbon protein
MADKRDVRTEKTPPASVRAQSAADSWDDDLTPKPAPPGTVSNEDLDARARGIKQTASTTLVIIEDLRRETSGQIAAVRTELKTDIAEVKGNVADVKGDVKALSGHVGDMREAVAEVNGKLDILPTLVKTLEHHQRVTFAAQVDVGKERAISEIDVGKEKAISEIRDTSDERKAQRKLKLKFAAIVSSIVAIISTLITLLAARC